MTRRSFLPAIAGSAVAGSLATASAQTLRWAAQNDILTLDPHSQNHATTNAILSHTYEGLTRYNAKYEVEPALAAKWTFISPTQVNVIAPMDSSQGPVNVVVTNNGQASDPATVNLHSLKKC